MSEPRRRKTKVEFHHPPVRLSTVTHEAPKCDLCGKEAEQRATVPMCGKRPRFWLCDRCLNDIDAYVEDVR